MPIFPMSEIILSTMPLFPFPKYAGVGPDGGEYCERLSHKKTKTKTCVKKTFFHVQVIFICFLGGLFGGVFFCFFG